MNKKTFYVVFTNIIITIALYNLLFYASNDDAILSVILGKKQNPLVLVINPILTRIIIELFNLFPPTDGYKLVLSLYIFATNVLIHYLLVRKFEVKQGSILFFLYVFSLAALIEVYTSFTVIAMFSAFVSWIYLLQENREFKIIGAIGLIAASLLRFTAIFPPLFILPLFLNKRNFFQQIVTVLLALTVPFLLEKYGEYEHSQQHKYDIIKLHKYRLGIDTFLFREKVPEKIFLKKLEETNFTRDDIYLISKFYAPLEPVRGTLQRYKSFYDLNKYLFTKKWLKISLSWIKFYLLEPPLFYLALMTLFSFLLAWLFGANLKRLFFVLILLFSAVFIISYFLTIPIYTRVASLFVGSVLVALLQIDKIKIRIVSVLPLLVLFYLVLNSYEYLEKEYKNLSGLSECIKTDKRKKYVMFPGKTLEGFRVKIPKELQGENVVFCDWVFWLDSEYSFVEQKGGFIRFITDENVYLIVENEDILKKLIGFIAREYAVEPKYKIIGKSCDLWVKITL